MPYLVESIKSLTQQDFEDLEIIVSDNGSTDETFDYCRDLSESDSRVKVIRQSEFLPVIRHFQVLTDEASGKYFMWQAHDDFREPTFVTRAVELLEAHSDLVGVFSNFFQQDLTSGERTRGKLHSQNFDSPLVRYIYRNLFPSSTMVYGLYRTQALRNAAGSDSFDWWDCSVVNALSWQGKIETLDEPLFTVGSVGRKLPYSVNSDGLLDVSQFLGVESERLHGLLGSRAARLLTFLLRLRWKRIENRSKVHTRVKIS